MDPPAEISDQVLINGTKTALFLNGDGNLRWTERGQQRCLFSEKDIMGFDMQGSKIKIRAVVVGGDELCCFGSSESTVRKQFVFELLNPHSEELWRQKLTQIINSLNRPKRLYVFVNPFGGNRSASRIFLNDVKPLLEDAKIEFTVQETEHQLHAKEITSSLDLSKYDGIVCVSGDGLLVEVVNGLLERTDWKDAIKMPIGVIPAGTGNGMIKSLLDSVGDSCTAINATLAVIRGHKRTLDVATLSQGDTRFFSVLMLAWGFVADVDIESEKYRWMGSARLDFYGLLRVLNLRKYNGRISFVPAPGFETFGEPRSSNIGGFTDEIKNYTSQKDPQKTQVHKYHGPTNCLDNVEWRTIGGPFISVWLHNVPWGAEDTMAAPNAKFSDGCLDLIIIRDCPKFSLMKLLTQLGSGDHVKSPNVMYLKVKAFVLEPGTRIEEPTKGGIIDVDGEVLARGMGVYKSELKTIMNYDTLRIIVDQGLATLYTPTPVQN